MTEPKKTMRVLVLWCDSQAANYGLRVLAQGNKELALRAFPEKLVEVDFQDFGPGDSDVSFGTKSILRDVLSARGPIKEKLRKYDLVIDSGAGDSFADIYGLKRLSFIIYAHSVIRKLGIPLVLAPQTVGPFNTRIGRYSARKSLGQAALVITRDSRSTEYSQSLGRTVDATATDVVFALPRVDVPASAISSDVIVNVSGLLWFSDNHVSSQTYRTATRNLVTELLRKGRGVSLLAHVVNSPSGNDDVDAVRALSSELQVKCGSSPPVLVPQNLAEAREYLGAANVVIGARMHACLNALSMGTPAIPWAYSRKFAPLMNDLGWDLTVDLTADASPDITTLKIIDEEDWDEKITQVARIRDSATRSLGSAASVISHALGEMCSNA